MKYIIHDIFPGHEKIMKGLNDLIRQELDGLSSFSSLHPESFFRIFNKALDGALKRFKG